MAHLSYTPFVVPLAVSAIVTLAVLYVAWQNRREESAPWFAASLVALLVWTIGYAFELMAVELEAKIAWANVQYVGVTMLPLLWLEVVLIYTGRRRMPRGLRGVLWVLCVVIIAMIFVNPGDLFRGHPSEVTQGVLTALEPDYGPLWQVFMAWTYTLVIVVVLTLVRGMLHARRVYVAQYAALLVATLIPFVAGSLYSFGLSPWPDYNPAMAVISVSGLLMAYALFHFRLFDVAPLARDAVIDGLGDGLVVLDLESRLRDFNPAALRVFPALCDAAVGRPMDEVLAIHPAMLDGLRNEAAAAGADAVTGPGLVRADISVALPEEGGRQREYTLFVTPVRTRSGRIVGHALTLHDVTDSAELLTRLEQLSSRDELTGLLSRRAWQEQADHEFLRAARYGYSLGLVLLDVDGLQSVNESYGQDTGDSVLRALAGTCQHALRPFDVVGRLGSDEVAVLLPHLSAAEALAAAERLRDAVSGLRVPGGDGVVTVSACLGVASTEHLTGELLPSLLHLAESALRSARSAGHGQVACAWTC
jgi:diguanylate cyclase (GGDEF)-like protein